MSKLFTKRNVPPPGRLRYDIPPEVRSRLLATFRDLCDMAEGGFQKLLYDVGQVLFKAYGHLCQPGYEAARVSEDPAIQHFFSCQDDYALDFIEACFQQQTYSGGQQGVDQVNDVFREHGIGYELTPWTPQKVEKELVTRVGTKTYTDIEIDYPRIVRIDSQLAHREIIEPALQLLTDSRLRVANAEMLNALSALRAGEHDNAITLACSAFESLLKTVCALKGWAYDAQRDTCSRLVEICRDSGLFPPFYAPAFTAVGTVRNKIGSAHGRGPAPAHAASQEHAEHMIRMTSAHMLLIAKSAGMA